MIFDDHHGIQRAVCVRSFRAHWQIRIFDDENLIRESVLPVHFRCRVDKNVGVTDDLVNQWP